MSRDDDIGAEQEYVSLLYDRLDGLRARASTRLAQALRATGGTHQARSERDAAAASYTDLLTRYDAAENGLCFGRLDFSEGERRYVGRLGIVDDTDDYRALLVDWRAPAARPFYLATAAAPDGVRRRRHIRTRLRDVVGVSDEVLDLAAADPAHSDGLTGEAALLAALTASRTGRMTDIVETIQAEQDRIIRSPHGGVLVVQGGAGTGKTAVALHRAAYLLYTYREQLSRRGVLIVGPNATFLRYIGQVLPSLGETSALLRTVGELLPGVTATRVEPPRVAEIKGRPLMVDVLAAAVRDREELPSGPLEIVLDGETVQLDGRACRQARERARRSRRPHNQARSVFAREIVGALARQIADRVGADVHGGRSLLDAADVEQIRRELRADAGVRGAIDRLWPVLTPQRLLSDLFSSPHRLATAASRLPAGERALLRREPDGGWTPADAPLLDEAAELLGEGHRPIAELAAAERRARVAEAQGVLDVLAGSAAHEVDDGAETLLAHDLIDPERLAERQQDVDDRTAAERAAADRTWAFGHVIVDEAQELSPMAWRMLMRRCPSRSMTIVGDVAQTGDLAGTSSWQRVLEPYVGDRWRLEQLTVNYRMPAEIMAVAADVLGALDPPVEPPRSVRETGVPPWRQQVSAADLSDRVAEDVVAEAAAVGDGRVAVLAPASRLDDVRRAVAEVTPSAAVGDDPDLDNPVVVLTVRQAKGLEFDSVLVVDPERIMTESPRGHNDLYVALTRATQRVGVLHPGRIPAVLARLSPRHPAPARRAG